jgi:hypothetical protein
MPVQERIEPAFEPLTSLIRPRQSSDAVYIERMRKSLLWWDRWRWIGVAVYVVVIVALLCVMLNLVEVVRELEFFEQPEMLVFIGVGIGASLGFNLHHCVWGLILMLSGLRSERLLVQYRDRFGDLTDE